MAARDKNVGKHVFVFNPTDASAESLCLMTDFLDNGDRPNPGVYTNQRLILQSNCNSAEFQLVGAALTPESLRKLANELESELIKAKANCETSKA